MDDPRMEVVERTWVDVREQYTSFSHHAKDDLISRMAAWHDREAATPDLNR